MRVWRTAAGWLLLAAGVVMLVAPGPGLLTIAAGLAVLARDHPWARRMRERLLARIKQSRKS